MSTNVGIVVLLCLLLILAMVRYRSSRATRGGGDDTRESAKRGLGKPALRLGRRPRDAEPEAPRRRRNRPRLGLTVSGVPTEEALLNTPAEEATATPAARQTLEASDAAILELAAGPGPADEHPAPAAVEPGPIALRVTVPDDATEEIPVALRGVVQDDAVIAAPGWPQPGELGLISATDGFAAGVDDVSDEPADLIVADPPPAAVASGDHGVGMEPVPAVWDEELTEFDPASGWGSPHDDPAEPTAHGIAQEWQAGDLHGTFDDAWSLPVAAADDPAEETPAEDATELADEQEWSAAEWDFAAVAAAPPIEIGAAGDAPAPADEAFADPFVEDGPALTWSVDDEPAAPDEAADDDEPDEVEPDVSEPLDRTPAASLVDEAVPPAHDATAWSPPPWPAPDSSAEAAAAWSAVVTPPETPKVDKRTRRLEKRLAAAEAELRRIAKRTKGKKGDLRTAGKAKIAKQVRKALGDPALAHHFDLHVGKGRFAFDRRSDALPVVTVGERQPGGEGSRLLAALEGPMRANLLAMRLRDYAHAEADRRVAALRAPGRAEGCEAPEFDLLVARLTELSQGALLGIEPPPPPR